MAETVTVTPLSGMDENGDPIPPGTPVVLTPIEIAPGNTSRQFGEAGDLDDAEFTVYLRHSDEGKVSDDDQIVVRGRVCYARVAVWRSDHGHGYPARGGIEVVCRSATGQAAR